MKKNRIMTLLLCLLLLLQCVVPGFATEATEESITETAEQLPETTEVPYPTGLETPPELIEYSFPPIDDDFWVRAKATALIELNSHTIVYAQELDRQLYPASLTKIMTCMLALENGNLDDILTVSETALQNLSEYGSTAGLMEGEQISLRELLYCIMVSSANEGCNVVAEYIAGSTDAFVAMMNEKAAALGMHGTHYANTHGLHNSEHYTTVRDLAVLAMWAWQNPQFREFATTTVHTVPATNKSGERTLTTTNYLTSTDTYGRYYYEKARGIKTGFTTPAGGCLISTATDGDLSFMSIVCGCEQLIDDDGKDLDMRFIETRKLFDYGFETFHYVQVLTDTAMLGQPVVLYAKGRKNVVVHAKENASVLLPRYCEPEDISMRIQYDSASPLEAPLAEGQRVGTVTAMYDSIPLVTSELVTMTKVEREDEIAPDPDNDGGNRGSLLSELLRYWYLTVPLLLMLFLLIILLIVRAVNIHKEKKRRRARQRRRRNG